ncbi:MAG: DUF3301 domain-containing protein [Gammaproteobacteria bacterium]|nr:MAG: DUF3301 domain-containing protein [Gammaproteobacteria bacterium]
MFELADIIIGYVIILLGWLLWQAQKSRESARKIAQKYCKQQDLQLLDDTVVLSRIRIGKDRADRFRIARRYRFEFSSMGDERYQGELELMGNELVFIDVEAHRI